MIQDITHAPLYTPPVVQHTRDRTVTILPLASRGQAPNPQINRMVQQVKEQISQKVTPIPLTLYKEMQFPQIILNPLLYTPFMTAEQIFQLLIPGNYKVTTLNVNDSITHTVSDKAIENDFKKWINKNETEDFNEADIERLRMFIRYKDLSLNEKTKCCQALYESLYKLLDENPYKLSFISYAGEEILLAKGPSEQLAIRLVSKSSTSEILISPKGEIVYKYYHNRLFYSESYNLNLKKYEYQEPAVHTNSDGPDSEASTGYIEWGRDKWETTSVLKSTCIFSYTNNSFDLFAGAKIENGALIIPVAKEPHLSPDFNGSERYEKVLRIDSKMDSCLELLLFKFKEIEFFLKNRCNQSIDFQSVSEECLKFLQSFEKLLPSNDLTNTPTCYSLGPIWSPIAASQDSLFTLMITFKNNEVSISSTKTSNGRGVSIGEAIRKVTISKKIGSDSLTFQIDKCNLNDLQITSDFSRYSLTKVGDITTLSGDGKDIPYIYQAASTLRDILRSLDSVILNEQNCIVTLAGDPLPLKRIERISNFPQETPGVSALSELMNNGDSELQSRRRI